MSSFGIFALILGIFYAGLFIGSMSLDGERRIRGIGIVAISGALIAMLIQSAKSTTSASSGVVNIFLFCSLMVFFIAGLGVLIGSLVGKLPAKSNAKRLAALLAIAGPAALVGWVNYELESAQAAAQNAETAARETFLNQTLIGSFGDHVVTFPVVPSLELVHACTPRRGPCHTHLWKSSGLNMTSPDSLELSSIKFLNHDDTLDELDRWCATRNQMLDTVWCEEPLAHDAGLSMIEVGATRDPSIWTDYPAPDQINSIVCFKHWRGLSCRVKFDVATGIEGYINTRGLTPQEAGEEALRALPRIARIWDAMSNQM